MTTILCNRPSGFSSKTAFVSIYSGESVHEAGKMNRVKPEEPRSQECVRRAALGSPRCQASTSSAHRSGPWVSTVSTIPGDAVERGTRASIDGCGTPVSEKPRTWSLYDDSDLAPHADAPFPRSLLSLPSASSIPSQSCSNSYLEHVS